MISEIATAVKIGILTILSAQIIALTLSIISMSNTMIYDYTNGYVLSVNQSEALTLSSISREKSVGAVVVYKTLRSSYSNILECTITFSNGATYHYNYDSTTVHTEESWKQFLDCLLQRAHTYVHVSYTYDGARKLYRINIEEVLQ